MKNNKKPNFFIVGAPKCGTRALYKYLNCHPDIFMPTILKEPHYFGSESPAISKEDYLSIFSEYKNEKRVGEASTGYLCSKDAAKQIKDFNKNAKIIIMLRNPVDMMYSLHSEESFSRAEKLNFEEAMASEPERKKKYEESKDYTISLLLYRQRAHYTTQVKRYLNEFGKDNVHIIIFDDFKINTDEEYKKTLQFLKVDDSFKPEFKIHNPNTTSRIPSLMETIFRGPKWLRKIFRFICPDFNFRNKIKHFVINLNTIPIKRSDMNPKLRKKLKKEFTKEVEDLSKLLEKDLTYWNK